LDTFTYEFGNEVSAILGLADQFVIGTGVFNPSIALRYRFAANDEQEGTALPNTGGEWLFLKPGIIYTLPSKKTVMLNTEIPLIADVGGTQLTPNIRINVGFLLVLNVE
ncbi:MAG: hypothetical protein AAGF85_11480, partial [Bacteroidota bacterium]